MQRTHASFSRPLLAAFAAAILALPFFVVPVGASSASDHLDEEVAKRLPVTAESQLIPVIVEGATGQAQNAESRVRNSGGHVVGKSSLLGATVAELTPAQIRNLATDPSVAKIHFDSEVDAVSTSDPSGSTSGSTPITFQQTIGATKAWQAGATGRGVTVAVLDTGIENDNSAFGARVKARVDFVDPAHPAQGDPAGHGTHIAGIIAASRDFASPGVAPDASLVSVRVLDAHGHSRQSTVIRGLEWTIAHRESLGIRVVVMALGAHASGSYRDDPLAAAAEMAWRNGIVVVVAAGNNGPTPGSISSPGIDPLVLTAGAADESGTPAVADDVIPSWSSRGPTIDGLAKPDVVAPGRKIVSVRVPGSTIDRLLPTHVEGPKTFRLSGTSESAAVSTGAVAVLLQQRARLTPDEVKALLVQSTNRLPNANVNAQGQGEIDVARALALPTPKHPRQKARPGDGLLKLLAILGLQVNWDQVNWDQVNWDQVNWDQVNWDQVNWDQVNWDQVNWDQVNWDQVNWDQVNWDQVNWD